MKIVLYAIPYEIANEANKLNELFKLDLKEYHLRKPSFTKGQVKELIAGIDPAYHNRVVLHHHYSLANKFGLKGIHVPENYFNGLLGKLKKKLFYANSTLQFSTSVKTIDALFKADGHFDEIHFGPLFTKFSEDNILERFESFKLKNALSKVETKVLGMGGICLKSNKKLNQLGLDGLVLQSAIWKSDDIINAFVSFEGSLNNQPVYDADMKIA